MITVTALAKPHPNTVTNTSSTIGSFCEIKDGSAYIKPEFLSLPQDLNAKKNNIIQSIKSENQRIDKSLNNLLVTIQPAVNSLSNNLFQIKNEVSDLHRNIKNTQKEIMQILEEIPATYRAASNTLIDAYLVTIQNYLSLAIQLDPYSSSMRDLNNLYSLKLDANTFNKIFPVGSEINAKYKVEVLKIKNTSLIFSLMIRDESLFNLFFKAAAASPIVKNSARNNQSAGIENANYFESARCILNRLLIGKINLNQTLIGLDNNSTQGNLHRQIYNDGKICLGATQADLEEMAQQEVSVRKEKQLRASIMTSLPQYLAHLSEKSNELLANMELGQYLGELYVYPELITQLNSDPSRASQQVNANELSVLLSEVQKNIEGEYQKFNELHAMRSIWKDRRMQNLFNSIINNCNYSFTNEAGAPVDFDFLIQKLTQAEDFYFISSAFYDISNLTLRLTDMSENELNNTLKNYLIQERINAVEMAITTILNRYKTFITPSINDTLIALESTITPLTQQIIADRLNSSSFEKLILLLVQKVNEQKQSVKSGELMLKDFSEQMITASNRVSAVLNEKSDPQNLKYDRAAHLAALSPWLNNLSEYNTERLKVIVKESDFPNQTKLWKSVNNSLQSETQGYGLSCLADGFFKSLALTLKNSLSKSKNPEYAAKAQSDCIEAQRFAKAAGLDRSEIYPNMSSLIDDLKKIVNNEDYAQFISDYRQELAAKDLNEFRMLDMPIENLSLTKEFKNFTDSR
ncbi:MAG: hypothetical protein ABL927_07110, partial [Bdellovibrionales bacterium]